MKINMSLRWKVGIKIAFNFNNQRMGFGNNNSVNSDKSIVKANFGARSIDDIKEEMNGLKYNHGLSNANDKPKVPKQEIINHQNRVNAIKQINNYNNKF